MNPSKQLARFGAMLMLGLGLTVTAANDNGPVREKDLQLTLPPELYATPGEEMAIYFDNLVILRRPEQCQFIITCKLGKTEENRWVVKPRPPQAGDYPLTVEVKDATGKKTIAKATTVLKVAAKKQGNLKQLRLLVVGDSLTAANVYPFELARLLDGPANPKWEMLGKNVYEVKVHHEGYSGWRWGTFLTQLIPGTPAKPEQGSSPFVFANKHGKPELDVPRYFQEQCQGVPPDVITVLLGINDCYQAGMNPDDRAFTNLTFKTMFDNAEILIKAFRQAAPKAIIGLCLTPPPSALVKGKEEDCPGTYHRWKWKRVQHQLVQEQLKRFGDREQENLFLIPIELNLDCVNGYIPIDDIHPNAVGYKQIGVSIYAWLKYRLQHLPKAGAATATRRR